MLPGLISANMVDPALQIDVLSALKKSGALTVWELASGVLRTPTEVAAAVRELTERGLTRPEAVDSEVEVVELTPRGKEALSSSSGLSSPSIRWR